MEKVHIIGIGDDGLEGLTSTARELIARAEVVIGPDICLRQVALRPNTEQISVGHDLDALLKRVGAQLHRRVVLLTPGDPLFYGVARFLCERLGKDRFEVIPHVSSMQLAFARVKESWEEAYLADLATTPLPRVIERARTAEKVGLFTTDESPPTVVAQALLERKIDYFSAYVCENLGSPDERVTQGTLAEIASQTYGPLNVLILLRKPDVPDRPTESIGHRLFGNPDELFLQSQPKRGLLTPAEVRVLAIADLDLGPASTVWDVGAGSGSVAIEGAMIASAGRVFAIERDPEDYQLIVANAQRFRVENLVPVLGAAPEAWSDLPDPDAVFIGGTGRAVGQITGLALERIKPHGRLVVHVSSIDNLAAVQSAVVASCRTHAIRMVQISHATDQFGRLRFEAMNPTFLISGVR